MTDNKKTQNEILRSQGDPSYLINDLSQFNSPDILDLLFNSSDNTNVVPGQYNLNDYKFKGGAIAIEYQVIEEKRLANALIEAAKVYNQLVAARMSQVETMNNQYGSELTVNTEPGVVTAPGDPPQNNESIAKTNYSEGRTPPTGVKPIVVLHETVGDFNSVKSLFNDPSAQVSYHAVVKLNGSIAYFVKPTDRAFGSAPANFEGQTSVNSFAYHISLESPPGRSLTIGPDPNHPGYTEAQYKSTAWLVARTGIPDERITTHAKVNTDGTRFDPYKFDFTKFNSYLSRFPREKKITFGVNGD